MHIGWAFRRVNPRARAIAVCERTSSSLAGPRTTPFKKNGVLGAASSFSAHSSAAAGAKAAATIARAAARGIERIEGIAVSPFAEVGKSNPAAFAGDAAFCFPRRKADRLELRAGPVERVLGQDLGLRRRPQPLSQFRLVEHAAEALRQRSRVADRKQQLSRPSAEISRGPGQSGQHDGLSPTETPPTARPGRRRAKRGRRRRLRPRKTRLVDDPARKLQHAVESAAAA